jgi:predicted O-methyltransferase YrrM
MRNQKTKEEELLERHVAKPSIIQWIEKRLENDGRLGINIGIQEGLILKSLCSQMNVEKVVEIGTQYGCSATWMALALGKRGQIYTLEKNPQCINNSRETFQHPDFIATGCQVTLIEGPALENLESLSPQGPFDLVFIDANKSGYLDYLHWAKKNVRSGGMILIDNIYLFGSVFLPECPKETPQKMWKVMKAVIAEQLQDSDYNTSIIPTPEGLLLSVRA